MNIGDYLTGDRLEHSLGVARKAREIYARCAHVITNPVIGNKVLECAKLHDIGYSEQFNELGFHNLDGLTSEVVAQHGRYGIATILLHTSAEDLVKYQSAEVQRVFKEWKDSLGALSFEEQTVLEIVTLADCQTDSKGNETTIDTRLNGILERYGEDDYRYKVFKDNYAYYKFLELKYNGYF